MNKEFEKWFCKKNPTLYRKWRFKMVSKMLEKDMINEGNGEKLKKISAHSLELITRTVECDGQTFYGIVQKVCDAIIHDGKAIKQTKRKGYKRTVH